jgi:hypothetical protein
MTSWSEGPFDRVQRRADLVLGRMLSEHQGQSRLVCVLDSHPGWIYKEYSSSVPATDTAQLDRLISFPAQLAGADRELVNRNASWPTARVVSEDRTVGVILPHAPDTFETVVRLPGGRVRSTLLRIDMLALPDSALSGRGVPPQPLVNRVTVCSSLVATAALFERHGIVYMDWSFANAFWSLQDHSGYVIDVDGCSFGPRQVIDSPGWEDPLVPKGSMGGHPVDRYRVALLVARCLTGERFAAVAPGALEQLARRQPPLLPVHTLVVRALSASHPEERPPIADLALALERAATALRMFTPNATTGNVTGWVDVRQRQQRPRPPEPTRQPVPSPESKTPKPWTTPVPVPTREPAMSGAAGEILWVVGALLALFVICLLIANH